jgi:hypothetical protein
MSARPTAVSIVILLTQSVLGQAAFAKVVPYALVVGNNSPPKGEPGLPVLRYADDDGVRYFQLFRQFAVESHLLAVLDEETQRRYPGMAEIARPPTLANVLLIVDDYAAKMASDRARGDDPVFYFAFSGHGASAANGSAAMLALLDEGLTQQVLYERILDRLPATYTHLLVDACHAGAVVGVRGDEGGAKEIDGKSVALSAAEVRPFLEATTLERYPSVGVILSTSAGQQAHEWSQIESGVFTHELLSGLYGAADANGDRRIEYTEVQAFIVAANRDVKDPRAVPRIVARPPRSNQNVTLVALSALKNAVVLEGALPRLGAFHVELGNGQRWLDAHLATDSPAVITLPGDMRAFVVTPEAEAEVTHPRGTTVALGDLTFRRRTREVPRGSIDADYRAGLFAAAYGAAYYHGFVDSIGAVPAVFDGPVVATQSRPASPRSAAIGLFAGAGASAIASAVTGALAGLAKRDFDATTLQRPAAEAADRYAGLLGASIATGALSIGAAIAGAVLWPRARPPILSLGWARDGAVASVAGAW